MLIRLHGCFFSWVTAPTPSTSPPFREPIYEIMALLVLHKRTFQKRNVRLSRGNRCLIFGLSYFPLPYSMHANSEGSGETAWMRRLTCAFASRLCDKYRNLMDCGSNEILILMGRCFEKKKKKKKKKIRTRFSCKNIQDRDVYKSTRTLCKVDDKKDRIVSWKNS